MFFDCLKYDPICRLNLHFDDREPDIGDTNETVNGTEMHTKWKMCLKTGIYSTISINRASLIIINQSVISKISFFRVF